MEVARDWRWYFECTVLLASVLLIGWLVIDLVRTLYNYCRHGVYRPPSQKNLVVVKGTIYKESVDAWIKEIKRCDGGEMDLIIHSDGGNIRDGLSLCHILFNYKGVIHTWVPDKAASGGTLLMFTAASKGGNLTMGRYSFITMINPMLTWPKTTLAFWVPWFFNSTLTSVHSVRSLQETSKGLSDEQTILKRISMEEREADILQIMRRALTKLMPSAEESRSLVFELMYQTRTRCFQLDRQWCIDHHIPMSDSSDIPVRIQQALDDAFEWKDPDKD